MKRVEKRTVKQLMDELSKFREDAVVWAYEGEVNGIGVVAKDDRGEHGFIHLDTSPRHPNELAETEVPDSLASELTRALPESE